MKAGVFLRAPAIVAGALFILVFFPSGCGTTAALSGRAETANSLAERLSFHKAIIQAGDFNLSSFSRIGSPGKPLIIYIEGDGLAWLNKRRLSRDPTPKNPLVLGLAGLDLSDNISYLARPCQFESRAMDPLCRDSAYWSNRRFSEEVIASVNEAVDALKLRSGSKDVHLVGYSGGAAVALLVAARRNDIASIRTIAGNLDPTALNRHHGVSELNGSLDPMKDVRSIKQIPQIHFVGQKDKIVPPRIAEGYKKFLNDSSCVVIQEVDAGHHSGWQEHWVELVKKIPAC